MDFRSIVEKFAQAETLLESKKEEKAEKVEKEEKKKKLKDWIEEVEKNVIVEAEQVTIAPAKQTTQVIKQGTKTLGTVTNPALAATIKSAIGKGEMSLAGDNVKETKKDDKKEEKVHPKHLKRQYRDNENNNYHTENALLLATHFGSDDEVKAARAAMHHRDKHGGYSSGDKAAKHHLSNVHAIHKKYSHKLSEGSEEMLDEKWAGDAKVKPTGQYKDKTKEELKSMLAKLKKSGPHGKDSPAAKKMRQINFALRAKGGWKSGEGAAMKEAEMDESGLQAYLGKKKYGEKGMKALQQAGREGASKEKMAKIRAKHDKLDEVQVDEKAVSKAQQMAAGIALAAKRKGEAPKKGTASAAMAKMPAKELEKFAKTKRKGLPKKKTDEAEIPNSGPDYGAGIGAGRNPKVLEAKPDFLDLDKDGNKKESMKKAAKDAKKKKVDESMDKCKAAYHEGKSHGLSKHGYSCRYDEGSDEHKQYHKGFVEGLDECYGMMPVQGLVVSETEPPATVPGMADQAMAAMEADMDEGNAFTAALAKTPKGGKFSVGGKTFTDRSNYDSKIDEFAFESLDKQLEDLLKEDTEIVTEGLSVSMSTGQQGSPDSVSVTASDDDAGKLLQFIKQVGLGSLGGTDAGMTHGEPAVVATVSDYGGPKFAGHDNPDMAALLQKVGVEGHEEDYKDEEGHEHDHGDGEAKCNECGMMEAECGCEKVEEVETPDQMTDEMAEDSAGADEVAMTSADEDAEAAEDQTKPAKGGAVNEGGDGGEASEEDEESVAESEKLDEWANEAGHKGTDAAFERDIEFMTKVIAGGLNKPKSTGQTTVPVIAGQEARMGDEDVIAWKKLAGLAN